MSGQLHNWTGFSEKNVWMFYITLKITQMSPEKPQKQNNRTRQEFIEQLNLNNYLKQ
jgi:hypothetical protein